MESYPPVTFATPDRAVSAGPQRNPMEDSDSSLTRKRPRLDSGSRSYRSMSADPFLPASATKPSVTARTPPSLDTRHTETPPAEHVDLPHGSTPSKMTINVRDAALEPCPTPTVPIGGYIPAQTSDRDKLANSNDTGLPQQVHSPCPDHLSPPLSSSRSPEIEVAEVEDISQDPGCTKWRTLASAHHPIKTADDLWAIFPYRDRTQNLWEAAEELCRQFHHHPSEDRTLLRELANWIRQYLAATKPHPPQQLEGYNEESGFWIHLVRVINTLCKRRANTVLPLPFRQNGSREDAEVLEDVLASFAALTLHMVERDCQTLETLSTDGHAKQELVSLGYLEWLAAILMSDESRSPLWRHLRHVYGCNAATAIPIIEEEICRSSFKGLALLGQLLRCKLSRARDVPHVITRIESIFEIVFQMVDHYRIQRHDVLVAGIDPSSSEQTTMTAAYEFFQATDATLQSSISKQVPALTHDICQTMLCLLSSLLRKIATVADDPIVGRVKEKLELTQNISMDVSPVILEELWKFQLFRKCFLEGRMEIRIQGVESMQRELVEIHRLYIQDVQITNWHPIVSFLSDFIVDNKLIDYLIGVESHPRLIRLAGNIVGFLIVTHRYTEAESDNIWDTVKTSRDPGVVGAVLQMLPNIFAISDYPLLLYLVEKLSEISLGAWDAKMTAYAESLFQTMTMKWKGLKRGFMDGTPYHCCIKLIREASVYSSSALHKRRSICLFANRTLEVLLRVGPSDQDRVRIYEDCIRHISGKTRFATGSICVINTLLRHDTKTDISQLAKEYGFVGLFIPEFEHITAQMSDGLQDQHCFDECIAARLDLFQNIITFSPDSLDTDDGWRLWEVTVGSKTPNDMVRDSALIMLFNATNSLRKRNAFVNACVSEYLPRLSPRFFTRNILYFVNQFIQHRGIMTSQTEQISESSQPDKAAIDMLWRIALFAPPNTVERKAKELLVNTYLDSPKTEGAPKSAIERMHMEVVERCVRQLTTVASRLKSFTDGTSSGEDEPMVIVASDEEVHSQRLLFSRSLLILKELFDRIRSHPSYSPVPSTNSHIQTDVEEINGVPITIRYQPFSGGTNRSIKSLPMGDLDNVTDLARRFGVLTGFAKFTVIVGGQKLDLEEGCDRTLRETRLHDKGLFLIKKIHGSETVPDLTQVRVLKPLETEVMGYFSEFYRFLSLDEAMSVDVLEFLKSFPPNDGVISLISSNTSSIDDVFPFATPFKALYSMYTYEMCLEISLQNGSPSQDFIRHGIQVMARSLSSKAGTGVSPNSPGETRAVAGLVRCLLRFLKEAARTDSSNKILSEESLLVGCLLALAELADDTKELALAESLICGSLGCIFEASLHSETFFSSFKNAGRFPELLKKALIRDQRRPIRSGTAMAISSICNHPTLDSPKKYRFAAYCWECLVSIIPDTLQHGPNSEDFFGVTTTVLRNLDDLYRGALDLTAYVQTWTNLLLEHHHDELAGRDNLDRVIYGISDLIQWCIRYIKSTKKPLKISGNLMELLLRAHLFPEISVPTEEGPIPTTTPVLHSKTRENLYSIVFALCNDIEEYHKLLKLARSLLPQGEGPQAWSWGIAQTAEDYSYDSNWNFERSNAIRSPAGYPGLRNLTNTCYMNSLLTQLFLNVGFRNFMLGADIVDRNHSQRLLAETRTLFGYMQGTALRAVDTQGIADSLINYENTVIDVSVQMDVDEFYNLLFDRLESQILSDSGKKSFRRFYGGQIVQQIKSKECPHISEREEPFSAIQCDIQGKMTLTESLSAYVGGEMMEGENKYSCTSCGTYVDAVKRACLKDLPDNLIFHLKRFDYDVMTGIRHKINDRFEFPEKIDMAPYSIEHLQDTEQPVSSDLFELVGILVHAGTAESGHYYSFIRERSVNHDPSASWVEFNDVDVTPFNPSHIPDCCFGGMAEPTGYTAYSKTYSAYMLFYQRVLAPDAGIQREQPLVLGSPIQQTLPRDLSERIVIDNEKFFRKYCLYDSTHARFTVQLLDRLRVVTNSCCSDDHLVEQDAVLLALEYADHVLSRMKDSGDFEKMLDTLATIARGCPVCCKLVLEWVTDNRTALRSLLLRCPTLKTRKAFRDMLHRSLWYLHENDPQAYGFDVDSLELKSGNGALPETSHGILQRLIYNLREFWPILHAHARAWDDYFGLLSTIACFGAPEVFVLLREDFLKLCLEILIIESPGTKRLRVENPHYTQFVRLIEKGRRYSFIELCELLQALLLKIDLEARPFDPIYHDREQLESGQFVLSTTEQQYLYYGTDSGRSRPLIFLDKIITANSNPGAVAKVLEVMISAEPPAGHLADISKTILNGVNIDPADLAAPHLDAAIVFCETTPSAATAKEMITQIASEVDTIGTAGGLAHLQFFVQARQLVNPRLTPGLYHKHVLKTVGKWAPPLLMYYDEKVRIQTVEFLKDLIFQHSNPAAEEGGNDALEACARSLCGACIKRVHENVMAPQSQVDVRSVGIIRDVIRHCVATYCSTGTAEDDQMIQDAEEVQEAIAALAVEEADEANSEAWNNSEGDLPSDSGSENLLASP
ncbi:MAG: hypothetical protein Q9168_001156 [Polycauliona sp. 1 TL-2023]